MSAFRTLVELALSAPIINPQLIMSCADEDRELGDLHGWSNDVDSLVAAFESQGDCLLGLRSDTATGVAQFEAATSGTNYISWGAFLCIDQDGEPDELVIDYTVNPTMQKIHDAWMAVIYS